MAISRREIEDRAQRLDYDHNRGRISSSQYHYEMEKLRHMIDKYNMGNLQENAFYNVAAQGMGMGQISGLGGQMTGQARQSSSWYTAEEEAVKQKKQADKAAKEAAAKKKLLLLL